MMRNRARIESIYGYVFIGPWLFGFLVFTLIPIGATLFLGFTDYDLFSPPRWIGVGNFRRMFAQDVRYCTSPSYRCR